MFGGRTGFDIDNDLLLEAVRTGIFEGDTGLFDERLHDGPDMLFVGGDPGTEYGKSLTRQIGERSDSSMALTEPANTIAVASAVALSRILLCMKTSRCTWFHRHPTSRNSTSRASR